MKQKKDLFFNISLMILTVVIFLIVLELIIGIPEIKSSVVYVGHYPVNNQVDYFKYEEESNRDAPTYHKARIKNGILIYHPQFRELFNTTKKNDTYRIIFIGDSVTYGQHVKKKKIFSSILENKLNNNTKSNVVFEVLNLAVCGYNLVQLNQLFQDEVLSFNPDLLIYGYFLNDLLTVDYIIETQDFIEGIYLEKTIPYIIKLPFNEFLLKKYKTYRFLNYRLINLFKKLDADIPINYYYLSHEESAAALNNMISTARKNNISLYIINFPSIDQWYGTNDFLTEYITKDNRNYVKIFNIREKLKGYNYEELQISPNDLHFSQRGHKVVSDLLYEDLIKQELIPT